MFLAGRIPGDAGMLGRAALMPIWPIPVRLDSFSAHFRASHQGRQQSSGTGSQGFSTFCCFDASCHESAGTRPHPSLSAFPTGLFHHLFVLFQSHSRKQLFLEAFHKELPLLWHQPTPAPRAPPVLRFPAKQGRHGKANAARPTPGLRMLQSARPVTAATAATLTAAE